MNITDAAKAQLEALLKENKADGLMMQIATSCCGASPMFSLAVFDDNDVITTINGIQVLIPEEGKELAEGVKIDVLNGDLVVENLNHSCHCHEEGCSHFHE